MKEELKTVNIETISGCNLKCSFCPNNYLKTPKKKMKINLYKKIIKQLEEIEFSERLTFSPYGEPLLDSRFVSLVKYARKKLPKAYVMINTNGTLLTLKKAHELVNAGCNEIKINCYSENVYNKVKDWDELYLGKIFKIIPVFGDYIKKYGLWNRGGNLNLGKPGPIKKTCSFPFTAMLIDRTGKVRLCCADYEAKAIMGDLNKEGLIALWNNSSFKKYRDLLKKGKREELTLCEKCNFKDQPEWKKIIWKIRQKIGI